MQIDGDGGTPSSSNAPTNSQAFGGIFGLQSQSQPFAAAPSPRSFAAPSSQLHQPDRPRHQWPAGLFSSSLGQPPSAMVASSSRDSAPQSSYNSIQQQPTVGGEPSTPVGSPMKVSAPASASRGAGSSQGAGGLGSPSWFSPKSRVRYSDRFIPSRAATARLDFSALDREVVADQVNKSAQDREVRQQRQFSCERLAARLIGSTATTMIWA